jgi:hypothetical protein
LGPEQVLRLTAATWISAGANRPHHPFGETSATPLLGHGLIKARDGCARIAPAQHISQGVLQYKHPHPVQGFHIARVKRAVVHGHARSGADTAGISNKDVHRGLIGCEAAVQVRGSVAGQDGVWPGETKRLGGSTEKRHASRFMEGMPLSPGPRSQSVDNSPVVDN